MRLIDSNAQWHWAFQSSLLAFIGFLPLFEAPKTITLILFLLMGFAALLQSRAVVRWQKSDFLIVLWAISGFIVALFAKVHGKEWSGATSMMWLGLVLLVVKKLPANDQQQQRFDHMVLLSTLLATLYGLWRFWITRQDPLLELNSVGHVNHSAIYLAVNFALAFALLLSASSKSAVVKTGIGCCAIITAIAIVVANSRTTVMVLAVIIISFALFWLRRSKKVLLVVVLGLTAVSSAMVVTKAPVVEKHMGQMESNPNFLGPRQAIWNSALLMWRHAPIFGVGIKNFGKVDLAMQQQWLQEEGTPYVEGEYLPFAHSHNFYLSLLAEQGLFGLLVTMGLMSCVVFQLYQYFPTSLDSLEYWCRWLAAAGAVEVILINGLFNTTLHHEHGLLSVLLIGWWWARIDNRQSHDTLA